MEKGKMLKLLGFATTVLGFGVSILSNWVEEKTLDAKITEEVAKALTSQKSES